MDMKTISRGEFKAKLDSGDDSKMVMTATGTFAAVRVA
jgi:hypothetical protein